MLEKIQFVDTDASKILVEIMKQYETETGKKLQPGEPERLILNAWAYRESLLRIAINETANANLVDFALAPALDALGSLVGVERLDPTFSKCTMQFDIMLGHTGVVIPEGLRVQSDDGKSIFALDNELVVVVGVSSVVGKMTCVYAGKGGNEYLPGTVTNIIDPYPFLLSASNTDTSNGGFSEETDDQLRRRIKLAPSQFSTAGSRGSYMFWTFSAHPSIIDVNITSPVPGTVEVFPLTNTSEETTVQVLDSVSSVLTDEKVRPLTDTVLITSPKKISYVLEVGLILYTNTDQVMVENEVKDLLEELVNHRKTKLGLDLLQAHIIATAKIQGVYNVVLNTFNDLIIAKSEFAVCTSLEVKTIGINEG